MKSDKDKTAVMNRKRRPPQLRFVILIVLLAACSSSDLTGIPVLNSDPSSTPTPSSTPAPLLTPTPTKTPQPTTTPRPTTMPTPTIDPYWQISHSPDGRYIAKMYDRTYAEGDQIIEVWETGGSILWTITYEPENPMSSPLALLSIDRWEEDGSVLYFYKVFGFDGAPSLWNRFDLEKIDILTGEIQPVCPGDGLMAFSFSPDGKQVAYVRAQDELDRITIRDLKRGEERYASIELPSEGAQAGRIMWSPGGTAIIFSTAEGEEIQVNYLNVLTMDQTPVLQSWHGQYTFDSWVTEDELRFVFSPEDEVIKIDVSTMIISVIGTATPVP